MTRSVAGTPRAAVVAAVTAVVLARGRAEAVTAEAISAGVSLAMAAAKAVVAVGATVAAVAATGATLAAVAASPARRATLPRPADFSGDFL